MDKKITSTWDLAAELAPPGFTKQALDKARLRGRIPHKWRLPILREAERRGIELPLDFFEPTKKRAAA